MMEIKTRVWDNTDKKMLFFDGIFNKRPYTEKSLMPQYESYPEYHDLEYMLYIDIKIKNSEWLYEGDILKTDDGNYVIETDFPAISLTKNNMEYDNGDYYCGRDVDCHPWESFELIGNIYENPELINGD